MSNNQLIPKRCDIVVIGGGPAGSGTATLLAREGFHVVVLEKEKFPRPQVGESILPQMWKFADMFGVSEKLKQEQFLAKAGGIIAWDGRIQQIMFSKFGYQPDQVGMHVERDIFDDILLRHAADTGAHVFEEVAFRKADFSDPQCLKIEYADRRGGSSSQGVITCRYVVDASGYASVLARQFGARKLVSGEKKHLGLWGYYKDSRYVGVDRKIHDAADAHDVKPVTFVSSFADGWIWHIILRESASVGLVIDTDHIRGMGKEEQAVYLQETCARTPVLQDLLAPSTFIEDSMGFRPDYSYYSEKPTGENFYCIGDAAAFVDPIFSQGVQAAFYNAAVCSWAISASFKNESRRARYSRLAQSQIEQYYGFARLLALGDFGEEGVNQQLVRTMMQTLPRSEMELTMAAAMTTDRSGNLYRMAREAGMFEEFGEDFGADKISYWDELVAA